MIVLAYEYIVGPVHRFGWYVLVRIEFLRLRYIDQELLIIWSCIYEVDQVLPIGFMFIDGEILL